MLFFEEKTGISSKQLLKRMKMSMLGYIEVPSTIRPPQSEIKCLIKSVPETPEGCPFVNQHKAWMQDVLYKCSIFFIMKLGFVLWLVSMCSKQSIDFLNMYLSKASRNLEYKSDTVHIMHIYIYIWQYVYNYIHTRVLTRTNTYTETRYLVSHTDILGHKYAHIRT